MREGGSERGRESVSKLRAFSDVLISQSHVTVRMYREGGVESMHVVVSGK